MMVVLVMMRSKITLLMEVMVRSRFMTPCPLGSFLVTWVLPSTSLHLNCDLGLVSSDWRLIHGWNTRHKP